MKHILHRIRGFTETIIFKNFSALVLLQISNTVLALILMPYLIQVLGLSNYGLYSFALGLSMYLVIITDYGFGFTGVKLISIHRNNLEKISEIFNSIQIIKSVILLIVLGFFTLAILMLDNLSADKEIYFLSFGILIGQTIVPVWFFHGMERMKLITIINLMIRLGAVVLIFILVREPNDIHLAIISQAISFTVVGVLSVIIAYQKFQLMMVVPKLTRIVKMLVDSRHMFFSTLSLSLYKNFNVVLLGFLTTNFEVGIYAAAERIIKAVYSLIAPMSQAIYPNLSRKFSKFSKQKSVGQLKKIATYYLLPLIVITFIMVFSKGLVMKILGIANQEFILVYYLLIPIVFLGTLNYLLGIVGLVNLDKEKSFQKITIIGSIVNLILCVVYVPDYGASSAAIALTITELLVLIMVIWSLYRMS